MPKRRERPAPTDRTDFVRGFVESPGFVCLVQSWLTDWAREEWFPAVPPPGLLELAVQLAASRIPAGIRFHEVLEKRGNGWAMKKIAQHISISETYVGQIIARSKSAAEWGLENQFNPPKWPATQPPRPLGLDDSVELLNLSTRVQNCLRNGNITTIGELVERGRKDLMRTRAFGKNSLKEVQQELARHGFTLKQQTPEGGPVKEMVEQGPN